MNGSKIRIGIIGCGEVTQINHFPSLKFLNNFFEVVAISDVSASVMNAVGDLHGVQHRFLNYQDLIEHEKVDAVLITTPHAYHCEQTLAAIAARKHVLVEKPMAMTLADADEIISAQERTGVVVQVGHMRRYATAFEAAVKTIKNWQGIRLARVHAVIGGNDFFVKPNTKVIRGQDVPADVIVAGQQLNSQKVIQAVGVVSQELEMAYQLMLGLCTHDISAMRELLGMPKRVLYAAQRHGGITIVAAFDYGDFVCQFETTIDAVPRFDSHLEVFSNTQVLRVQYNTPYVRHLATKLEITTAGTENNIQHETLQPAFEDNFTQEWRAFYDNVVGGNVPKTNPKDFRQDLELFMQMMEHFRKQENL